MMKKVLIILVSCLMLVSSVGTIFAEDNPPISEIETTVIKEVTGGVKVDEISDVIADFNLTKEESLKLTVVTSKVSVKVMVYDDKHDLVADVTTDYDDETETGSATLGFVLPEGNYTIETMGVVGEGSFEYVLSIEDKNDSEPIVPDVQNYSSSKMGSYAVTLDVPTHYEMYFDELKVFNGEYPTTDHYSSNIYIADFVFDDNSLLALAPGHTTVTFVYDYQGYTIDILVSHVKIVGTEVQNDHTAKMQVKKKMIIGLAGELSGLETTYRSTNTAVATVKTTDGITVVTALKAGTTYIIATRGKYADAIKITVTK
jgi:hypothetical protein